MQEGFIRFQSNLENLLALWSSCVQCKIFNPCGFYNAMLQWVAYVDLKAAFDSVDRTALWQLLLSVGLPHRMVELFKALYTDTVSCVRADGCESEWFPVNSGVRQGCVVAPD